MNEEKVTKWLARKVDQTQTYLLKHGGATGVDVVPGARSATFVKATSHADREKQNVSMGSLGIFFIIIVIFWSFSFITVFFLFIFMEKWGLYISRG